MKWWAQVMLKENHLGFPVSLPPLQVKSKINQKTIPQMPPSEITAKITTKFKSPLKQRAKGTKQNHRQNHCQDLINWWQLWFYCLASIFGPNWNWRRVTPQNDKQYKVIKDILRKWWKLRCAGGIQCPRLWLLVGAGSQWYGHHPWYYWYLRQPLW